MGEILQLDYYYGIEEVYLTGKRYIIRCSGRKGR